MSLKARFMAEKPTPSTMGAKLKGAFAETSGPNRKGLLALALLSAAVMAPLQAEAQQSAPFSQKNLVSDIPGKAVTTDPLLVDPWGVAFAPTGAFWINDAGTGVSTLYDGAGVKVPAVFTVPQPAGATGVSAPTGIVWNSNSKFLVPTTKLPAVFIFATLEGTISAWAPALPTNPTSAVLAVDNSKTGAVYTGLDSGITAAGGFLYAANLSQGTVDVFDSTFAPAGQKLLGAFKDPTLPAGYAPFNVRNVDGALFVTYAKQNSTKTFVSPGPGNGLVDVFDTDGRFVRRFATGGELNAPWGVTVTPEGFAGVDSTILVGNFGDGLINSFEERGRYRGPLTNRNGDAIAIPGLWTLSFGGAANSSQDQLFFTAGIDRGAHGLFGTLTPVKGKPQE